MLRNPEKLIHLHSLQELEVHRLQVDFVDHLFNVGVHECVELAVDAVDVIILEHS